MFWSVLLNAIRPRVALPVVKARSATSSRIGSRQAPMKVISVGQNLVGVFRGHEMTGCPASSALVNDWANRLRPGLRS